MKGLCEFCGQKKEIESTTMTGWGYCIECHEINIEESEDAILIIKGRSNSNKPLDK